MIRWNRRIVLIDEIIREIHSLDELKDADLENNSQSMIRWTEVRQKT
jgi:hypothetical protein